MSIVIRKYEQKDIEQMNCIWNEVVDDGIAFPQLEILDDKTGEEFFSPRTYCGVAEDDESGEIAGLYILHQTISDGADILQTQVMPYVQNSEDKK